MNFLQMQMEFTRETVVKALKPLALAALSFEATGGSVWRCQMAPILM